MTDSTAITYHKTPLTLQGLWGEVMNVINFIDLHNGEHIMLLIFVVLYIFSLGYSSMYYFKDIWYTILGYTRFKDRVNPYIRAHRISHIELITLYIVANLLFMTWLLLHPSTYYGNRLFHSVVEHLLHEKLMFLLPAIALFNLMVSKHLYVELGGKHWWCRNRHNKMDAHLKSEKGA